MSDLIGAQPPVPVGMLPLVHFWNGRQEGKIVGLAAYGNRDILHNVVLERFQRRLETFA